MLTTTPTNVKINVDRNIKYRCYLVCVLAFLLSVSSANVSRVGLFFLLLFAPLMTVHRLRNRWIAVPGRHLLWLLLALAGAVGIVSSGYDLIRLVCFLLSLLFWAIYLCCRTCGQQVVPFKDICLMVFEALFSDPYAFFIPNSTEDLETRKSRIAKWIFKGYILAAVFVALLLLLTEANENIIGILQAVGSFVVVRAPLLISCMALALFPAAVIYSFVTKIESVTTSYGHGAFDAGSTSGEADPADKNFPWCGVYVLVIIANWFLVIVEIFYTWYLSENPLAQDYNFYDVFIIFTLIFLSMAVMLHQTFVSKRVNRMLFVMLGLSDIGLIVIAGFRLCVYIKFHGLWADRVLLVVALMLCLMELLCILSFSYRQPWLFVQRAGSAAAISLAVLLILPKGFVLTEINASIFLHKYYNQQLNGQVAGTEGTVAELSEDDLHLELMEYYGIDGVPALVRLSGIEDVTIHGQALSVYARSVILDCFCADLGLTRSGNDADDVTAVLRVTTDIPRYRLPSAYSMARRCLESISSRYSE